MDSIDFSRPEFNFTARLADATKNSYPIGAKSPVIGMVGAVLFNLEASKIDIPLYIGSNDLRHKDLHPSAEADLPDSSDPNFKDRVRKLGTFLPVIDMLNGTIDYKNVAAGWYSPASKILRIDAFGCLPLDGRPQAPKLQQLITALSTYGLVAAMLMAPSLSVDKQTQIHPREDNKTLRDIEQKLLRLIGSQAGASSFFIDC